MCTAVSLVDCRGICLVNSAYMWTNMYIGNMIIRGESIAYFCGIDAEAYLRTFNYDGSFDRQRLLQVARKRNITASSPPTDVPLKYIEIDEALRLLKAELDSSSGNPRALSEMLGNDPFV